MGLYKICKNAPYYHLFIASILNWHSEKLNCGEQYNRNPYISPDRLWRQGAAALSQFSWPSHGINNRPRHSGRGHDYVHYLLS